MFYNKKVILLVSIFSCFASNCGAMEYCIRKRLIADPSIEKSVFGNVFSSFKECDAKEERLYKLKKLREYGSCVMRRDISGTIKLEEEIRSFGLDYKSKNKVIGFKDKILSENKPFSRTSRLIQNNVRILNLINEVVDDYDHNNGGRGSYFYELHRKVKTLFGIEINDILKGNRFTWDMINELKKIFEKIGVNIDVEAMLIKFPDSFNVIESILF